MATVWRAMDEQLGREVAVKILRPQFGADPGFAARFRNEARAAGALSHPNVVQVYDFGTDVDSGDQYIVMQLVEGQDLATVLRERVRSRSTRRCHRRLGSRCADAAHRRAHSPRHQTRTSATGADAGHRFGISWRWPRS
jgi:serine/threonine protein kinase